MTNTYTFEETFTIANAKHIAAKVVTDLKRIQRFYGHLTDEVIQAYEEEIIELLKAGYLNVVTYGFRRNGSWIVPTLRYTAKDLAGMTSNDDDPGRVVPSANIEGAQFYSYLTYNSKWDRLTEAQKANFKNSLPFQRGGATEPNSIGYFTNDKTYSSGGRALDRSSLKSFT